MPYMDDLLEARGDENMRQLWGQTQGRLGELMQAYAEKIDVEQQAIIDYYIGVTERQEQTILELRKQVHELEGNGKAQGATIEIAAPANLAEFEQAIQKAAQTATQHFEQRFRHNAASEEEKVWDDVRLAYRAVWTWRARLASKWPTPVPYMCKVFAATEAHEAVDAWTRTQPEFQRNRATEKDEIGEWADCGMMILSAYPRWSDVPKHTINPPQDRMELASLVSRYAAARGGTHQEQSLAADALYSISRRLGYELAENVERRLHRIAEKVGFGE